MLGSLDAWKFGSLDAWKFGSLEAWMLGSLEVWKFGSLDAWMLGCLEVWKLGCLEVWKFGSLEAWMLGSLEAWMLGCLDAWKFGSLEAWKLGLLGGAPPHTPSSTPSPACRALLNLLDLLCGLRVRFAFVPSPVGALSVLRGRGRFGALRLHALFSGAAEPPLLGALLRPYRGRPRTLKGFDPDHYRVSPSTTIVVDLGPL